MSFIGNFTTKSLYRMESKLLDSGIQDYSTKFARKICDEFFQDQETISGSQILNLTSIEQINLFTIRTLYHSWSQQMSQSKSPFFDFQDQHVQQALKQLLNILSRKIKVDREHFEPVVNKAVSDTIRLVFSPYDYYFGIMIPESAEIISTKELEDDLKYIKVNQGLLLRVVELVNNESRNELTKKELQRFFDRILQETDELPEDFGLLLNQLTEIEPLTLDQIYTEANGDKSGSLNERYSTSQQTVNDQLSSDQRSTVAGSHEAKKIDNILASLSVNQRYMFVNELFSGDTNQFTEAFEKLEGFENYQEAVDALNSSYAGTNNWDFKSPFYLQMLEILDKRYN